MQRQVEALTGEQLEEINSQREVRNLLRFTSLVAIDEVHQVRVL